jgi:hypothetical protein
LFCKKLNLIIKRYADKLNVNVSATFDFYMLVLQWDAKVTTDFFTIRMCGREGREGEGKRGKRIAGGEGVRDRRG